MITPAVRRTAEAIVELLDELADAVTLGTDLPVGVVVRVRERLSMLTRVERREIRDLLRGVFRDDVLPSDAELDEVARRRGRSLGVIYDESKND